jgi:hypothetical protein
VASIFFATGYSFVWSTVVLVIGFGLILADRSDLMNRAITGTFLISVLAVPFYVLLPVYDPWTTNPIYGNPGAVATHIQYLYPLDTLSGGRGVQSSMKREFRRAIRCVSRVLPPFCGDFFGVWWMRGGGS